MQTTTTTTTTTTDSTAVSALTPQQQALISAIQKNDAEKLNTLLVQAPPDIIITPIAGKCLLHIAADCGFLEIIQVLLQHGAEINQIDAQNKRALDYAKAKQFVHLYDLLMQPVERYAQQLLAAVKQKEFLLIRTILGNVDRQMKRDIINVGVEGEYPLHIAVNNGEEQIVKYLVKYGAELTQKDANNKSPLNYAEAKAHSPLMRYLSTAMAERQNFLSYCKEGKLEDIELYIERKSKDYSEISLEETREDFVNNGIGGKLPLHVACEAGQMLVVKCLLKETADLYLKDQQRHLPENYARLHNHQLILQLFTQLQKSATAYDPQLTLLSEQLQYQLKLQSENNKCYKTYVLHLIEKTAWYDMQQQFYNLKASLLKSMLASSTDLNLALKAAYNLFQTSIERILQKILAAAQNDYRRLTLIDKHTYSVLEQQDFLKELKTTLMKFLTAQQTIWPVAERSWLTQIQAEAYSLYIKQRQDYQNNLEIKESILKKLQTESISTNETKIVYEQASKTVISKNSLHSFLDLCRSDMHTTEIEKQLIECSEVNLTLITSFFTGTSRPTAQQIVNQMHNGMLPLHTACANGALANVKLLLTYGAIATARDEKGYTALDHAAGNNHVRILKFLIGTKKVNVNLASQGKIRALHSACYFGKLEAVKYLLSAQAQVNLQSEDGATALHKAVLSKNPLIIKKLLKKDANPMLALHFDQITPLELVYLEYRKLDNFLALAHAFWEFGITLTNEQITKLQRIAKKDPDFPAALEKLAKAYEDFIKTLKDKKLMFTIKENYFEEANSPHLFSTVTTTAAINQTQIEESDNEEENLTQYMQEPG